MLWLHLNMLNKPLLTTTSFCCWRVKLSVNMHLSTRLVLLSLLESTSSSSAAACYGQQERTVSESRLDILCVEGRYSSSSPATASSEAFWNRNSPLFTVVSTPSAPFPTSVKKGLFQSSARCTKDCHCVIWPSLRVFWAFLCCWMCLWSVPHHARGFGGPGRSARLFLAPGCQCAVSLPPGPFPPNITPAVWTSGRCSLWGWGKSRVKRVIFML